MAHGVPHGRCKARDAASRSPGEGRGGGGRDPRAPSIVQVGIRRERRRPFIHVVAGERGGAISCHPRSLPDYCCCSGLRRANVARTGQGTVHGGVRACVEAAALLEAVAMGDGLLYRSASLLPVDPWWRGAGAPRSN